MFGGGDTRYLGGVTARNWVGSLVGRIGMVARRIGNGVIDSFCMIRFDSVYYRRGDTC